MSRSGPWAPTPGVTSLAIAIVLILAGCGGSGSSFQAEASAVCTESREAAEQISDKSPSSISEGLEILRRGMAIHRTELARLRELAPQADAAFRVGLADDEAMLEGLSSIVARRDYIKLALTLPGHPKLVPGWLKRWLAHEQALMVDARAQFSKAGVPACRRSLG